MEIVHGPHSETFLKINANAWLALQKPAGFYFGKLEVRVRSAPRLLYSEVPPRLQGPRFLPSLNTATLGLLALSPARSPHSFLVAGQCQTAHFTSRNDSSTRSHVSPLVLLEKQEILLQVRTYFTGLSQQMT